MISEIKNFFEGLLNLGSAAVSALTAIPKFFVFLTDLFLSLPSFLSAPILLILSFLVVRLIISLLDKVNLF